MKKIVLIGAGSAQFGFGTLGELFTSEVLRDSEVVLLDINPTALEVVHKTASDYIEQHQLATQISATTDRQVALKGADFVVISIEVGDRFEHWDQDRTIPQQYGIQQVYGENGGPGGLFHSLRIIPPILEICEDVARICPEAFVFNYSNPMSRICTTVARHLPEVKFVGLCHEVASLERYLPTMLNTPFEELKLTAAGLNHFSCLLEAHYADGTDAYPDIRQKAPGFFADLPGASDCLRYYKQTGRFIETEGVTELDTSVAKAARQWTERTMFKFVLEQFDLLPITTDSHFGEYLPWAYDVVDHQGILEFYEYYRLCLANAEPRIELGIRERVVPIMEAIVTDSGMLEAAVNIPNNGFIEELPSGIAVEVPAVIGKNGVVGVKAPALPLAFAGILQNQVGVHHMTAEAVLSKSRKAVVQALLVDPVVTQARGLDQMVDLMCNLQEKFLGYLT